MNLAAKMQTVDFRSRAKDRQAIERLARIQVENELDLQIFYVIGDANGPLADEVRIGFTKRSAFQKFKDNFALYRSRKIIAHVAICVSGEATARRIKAAMQLRLIEDWRKISDRWWKVTDAEAQTMVAEIIEAEEIRIFSADEADALEGAKLGSLMDRIAGI